VLERGRLFNSAGDRERARTLFIEAWEQARAAKQVGLAVDAAHMVAITDAGTEEALEWNRRGLELAGPSRDPKAHSLIPAMLNNSAWDLHSMERFGEALSYFEKAEAEWTARGKPVQTRIAKWSVARCLRSLGRHKDALARQRALEEECKAAGTPDGHVFEEIAENLAALGESEDAKVYFGKAYEELNKDAWLRKNEAERLESLAKRARTG
jgi:tetratricopeptide (TPR) repeat protein